MNRLRVKAGSARAPLVCMAVALALLVAAIGPSRAAGTAAAGGAATPNFWFAGTRLVFERAQFKGAALAVPSDDYGLGRFLTKLGATLSFQPGQNYIVVSTGDHRTVTFTLGDVRYTVGGVTQSAAFAPYLAAGVAYLPFLDLARALYVLPMDDGGATVLEPQIASLDVRTESRMTVVTLRGASPLHFKLQSDANDERVSLAFSGIASTLEPERQVRGAGLRGVSIDVQGSPRNPTTVVSFDAAPGSVHALAPTDTPNALAIAFAPAGTDLGGTLVPAQGDGLTADAPLNLRDARVAGPPPPPPPSTPSPSTRNANVPSPNNRNATVPTPQATEGESASASVLGSAATPTAAGLQTAAVTAFDTIPTDAGLNLRMQISGPVTYEWHRLSDNRWYVDLKPATLAVPPQDQALQNDAVLSLRLKSFVGPNDRLPTVRVALTLAEPRVVNLVPADGGLTLVVDRVVDPGAVRSGVGELTGGQIVASVAPQSPATPNPAPTWKFAPPAAGTNAKLIVIDPGHGGSDTGAMHNGLVEKDLALDISKRLRAVLIARGWQVKMTRDSDVDVYQPNDSARDELQARDDIANGAGARMLISVHCNAFTSSGLNGTTTYYYKPDSYALADAVHAHLSSDLPTRDDGIRKENFYVIHHATMPSILIETAFVSNPGDAALLRSPAFLQKLANSIADGVGDYASAQPMSSTSSGTDGY